MIFMHKIFSDIWTSAPLDYFLVSCVKRPYLIAYGTGRILSFLSIIGRSFLIDNHSTGRCNIRIISWWGFHFICTGGWKNSYNGNECYALIFIKTKKLKMNWAKFLVSNFIDLQSNNNKVNVHCIFILNIHHNCRYYNSAAIWVWYIHCQTHFLSLFS